MSHKKKIFLVGGADASLRIPMAQLLIAEGFEVTVIGSEPSHYFDQVEIKYLQYSLDRTVAPLLDIKSIFELYRIFRNHRPEVVHSFDTKPNILATIAAWLARVPTIIRTINGMGSIFSEKSARNLVLKQAYYGTYYLGSLLSQFTIFQNTHDMEYFLSRGLVSSTQARYVAGSGVCIAQFQDTVGDKSYLNALRNEFDLNNKCTIILISRIIKQKGIIQFLESARAVSALSDNTRFLLVGSIEMGSSGIELSVIEAYSNVCQYLGHRGDVSSLIAISDVVVLPSYYKEGVPRSLIEGASLGKPLISTKVSGCSDIVVDNYNGVLVPPKDTQELTRAILHLVNNAELRAEMGLKGRELVDKKFSLQRVCEGWSSLY